MPPQTETERYNVLRLSNKESNKLTRESIRTALVFLIGQKPFDKIKITEIVNRAGVSRTAFYRNYTSKEDVVQEICEELLKWLSVNYLPVFLQNKHACYVELFNHLKERKLLVEMLQRSDLAQQVLLSGSSLIESKYTPKTPEEHYCIVCKETVSIKIILEWIKGGMRETPEEMARICEKMSDAVSMQLQDAYEHLQKIYAD